jgi:hypothetical protein
MSEEQLDTFARQYIVHETRITELSDELKVLRKLRKDIETDIMGEMSELDMHNYAVDGHVFTVKTKLQYKSDKK